MMESTAISKGAFLLWFYIILQQETTAFRWTQRLRNDSTLHHCVGDDVTFAWSYVTEPSETVLAKFFFSRKNGTLASRFNNRQLTSSNRVRVLPDAVMTLSGVTSDDAGIYGIHVKLRQSSLLYTQVVNLVVIEPPKLADKKLKVEHLSSEEVTRGHSKNNKNKRNSNDDDANDDDDDDEGCGSGGRLRCGQLVTVGVPPVSVVWTDPDKKEHKSSPAENGHFLLDLPASYKGGNYTCSLVLQPEVSACLRRDRPLMTAASIFLETTDTKVDEQADQLQELTEELEQVRTETSKLQRSQSALFMQEIEERIRTLEENAQNVTQELDNQRGATDMLRETNLKVIEDVKRSFHNALVESEAHTKRTMEDNTRKLSGKVDDVTNALSLQKDASSKQGDNIQVLQRQLKVLQDRFQDQQNLNSQLRSDLSALRGSLEQQKTVISDLQDKLHQQQEENDRQKRTNSEQKRINSEQLKAINDLQSNVSTLLKRLEHGEEVSALLQSKQAKQQEDIDAQKSASAEQQKRTMASLQNSVQMQQNSTDRLQEQLKDNSAEFDRKVLALGNTVRIVQENLTALSTRADSQLESLRFTLSSSQRNLSSAMAVLKMEQQLLSSSLSNSSQALEMLADLEETLSGKMGQVGNELLQELTADVEVLHGNVSAVQSQCQALLPRVTSLESGMERVDQELHPIRLVGGSNEREGRVEVRVGRRWGTVCDDSWDNNDAKVVCNMLGFFAAGAVATTSAHFGQGSGPIVLDDVDCDGSEQDLQMCTSRAFGTHNCQHSEDAGVVCAGL